MRRLGSCVAIMLGLGAPSAPAHQAISLPIVKGFWITSPDKCASATTGHVYDGARWGPLYFYGPNASMGPAIELEVITQTRPAPRGFTHMQFGGYDGVGDFQVKSLGPDRMTFRTNAPGPGGIQVLDETLVRCDFKSVSKKIQAALKRAAPSLAK